MEIEKLKKIEYGILKYIDSICKKNKICYFLDSGTLIGAVRHKGFIPWDDDIDIVMKREDYMRFEKIVQEDDNEIYKILSPRNNKTYYHSYNKVVDIRYPVNEYMCKKIDGYGVWVDIFPLDNFDAKKIKLFKLYNLSKKRFISSQDGYYKSEKGFFRSIVKRIMYALFCKKDSNKYALKIDEYLSRVKSETSYLYAGYARVRKVNIFKSEIFKDVIGLPFEDGVFPCPIGYDERLKQEYGDYMTPPPKNNRISKHNTE